jgi:hypothetical protein
MKRALKIILPLMIVGFAWMLYDGIMAPERFKKERELREAEVIQRLKDIRSAQHAFKRVHQRYVASFDTLIAFVLNDSLTFERAIGSDDDSLAVAQGKVTREKFKVAVKDTAFVVVNSKEKALRERKLSVEEIENLRYIPFSGNTEFILDAGYLTTESQVVIPVFEAKAPYITFLDTIKYRQDVINLLGDRKRTDRYKGIKVGSMTEATNDAGNWE